MHVARPEPHAVHHHLPDGHVRGVHDVAGPGVVSVSAPIVQEQVVRGVVDAAIRIRRADLVPLHGVVVDHVDDDLDAGRVQRPHQVLHLGYRPFRRAGCGVLRVRREEVQRHVPPVAALLGIALEHRHQFDHRDAEVREVRDLVDDAGERAAAVRLHTGVVAPGEAANMHLVDDRVRRVSRTARLLPPIRAPARLEHAERRPTGVGAARPWPPRGRRPAGRTRRGRTGSSRTFPASKRRPAAGRRGRPPSTRSSTLPRIASSASQQCHTRPDLFTRWSRRRR